MMNVIIVDDEILMRIGLKSMIDWESYGFHIVGEAANGKEAMELAQLYMPELIITDIKMPVMDGIELIREASSKLQHCQYVILSCLDEFQYAKEAVRLGAVDYLIKSDIKQQQLLDVLDIVKQNAEKRMQGNADGILQKHYKEGIGFLKETLFKEMFSGFRQEEDILRSREPLNIRLTPDRMVVVKLRIDRFEEIKLKYVEQDEKLLRYAVLNMLEELIPRKWNKELIVESSAEYILVLNVPSDKSNSDVGEALAMDRLDDLFTSLTVAMKDFLHITISIGVSGTVPGFGGLRRAYLEADTALKERFFVSQDEVVYYQSLGWKPREDDSFGLSREEEDQFRRMLEDGGDGAAYLEKLRNRLDAGGVTERASRKSYIRVLSLITSCYPSVPWFGPGDSPYERLLREERLADVHGIVLEYLKQCQTQNDVLYESRSYAEQASEMIRQQYAEDISLQSVARQINVNPSYLSRVFKQETGSNFVSFLTEVRMEKAKQLLQNKQMKVYEVADRVGYPNTAYFSKLFKKLMGQTPEEYRSILMIDKKEYI
ncbi:helix-turn-helix domain-containing protein [Paenibacillus sp. PR3]|uniref:Helix-turn-helix domain-containing protein n=1 Tax=Paenibacillus terricola TaxID=2763503 RepID=A0ABR8MYA3_9BACL|nr:helix-turn-helix domain-containing protein [Paenibacillus terricola]MBD3919920.1 helix-turn-helix domain-containing protein [Paenibacillus terricola]